MKIRKFNEDITSFSNTEKIIEYVKDCFVEFIDNGSEVEEFVTSEGLDNLVIKFVIPSLQFSWILKNKQIDSIFDNIIEAAEISERIQKGLEMVLSKFDESKLEVEARVSGYYIQLHFKSLI
jgi:hypothetical protein